MFVPPLIIRSFERSLSVKKPSSSTLPRSPVCNQPPRSDSAVAWGLHHVAANHNLASLADRQGSVLRIYHSELDVRACDTNGAKPFMIMRIRYVGMEFAGKIGDGHRAFTLTENLDE